MTAPSSWRASLARWVPIGAVQTASGYDVAWELPGANEYTVWSTDSNGNYIANHHRRDGGKRLCIGVDRDDIQPRPERRWGDRPLRGAWHHAADKRVSCRPIRIDDQSGSARRSNSKPPIPQQSPFKAPPEPCNLMMLRRSAARFSILQETAVFPAQIKSI